MKYDLILLDLDGTILDFKASEKKSLKKLFEELNIEYKNDYHEKYSEINKAYWKRLERGEIDKKYLKKNRFKDFFKSINIETNSDENNIFLHHLSVCDDIIEGSRELLERIHGKLTIIAATNGIKTVQHSRLKSTGFDKYFDLVVTSEEAGHAKPRREFFDFCTEKYPEVKKKRILMIGDSLDSDIRGAIDYEIDSCWFNPKSKETELKPTYTINKLDDIIQIIESA